jgi:hypothetical protein
LTIFRQNEYAARVSAAVSFAASIFSLTRQRRLRDYFVFINSFRQRFSDALKGGSG